MITWVKKMTHSEETRKKISKNHARYWLGKESHLRGTKLSDEHRKKLSDSHKGYKHSEEAKRKMSEAKRGKKMKESARQKLIQRNIGNKYNQGKKCSEEKKKRISESNIKSFKDNKRQPPLHGYGINGIREDIGHFVRSRWEANVARILNFNNINYEYEPERFDLGDLGTYLPDFYLPEKDLYIEVKGYFWGKDENKLNKFKESNDMLLIEEKSYKQLASSYSQFIENWECD